VACLVLALLVAREVSKHVPRAAWCTFTVHEVEIARLVEAFLVADTIAKLVPAARSMAVLRSGLVGVTVPAIHLTGFIVALEVAESVS
jgi:hypothetical protein